MIGIKRGDYIFVIKSLEIGSHLFHIVEESFEHVVWYLGVIIIINLCVFYYNLSLGYVYRKWNKIVMKRNRSLEAPKTTWRSRDKHFLTATSWYQSNFHDTHSISKPHTAHTNTSSSSIRGLSSHGSIHKFRSRYLPPALTIK